MNEDVRLEGLQQLKEATADVTTTDETHRPARELPPFVAGMRQSFARLEDPFVGDKLPE